MNNSYDVFLKKNLPKYQFFNLTLLCKKIFARMLSIVKMSALARGTTSEVGVAGSEFLQLLGPKRLKKTCFWEFVTYFTGRKF